LTDYMFANRRPLFMRALSLYHVVVTFTLIWLVYSLGYASRAWLVMTIIAWIVLPATYLLTRPEHNINRVFGFGNPPRRPLPPKLWVFALMMGFPILIYLPTHLLLRDFLTARDRCNRPFACISPAQLSNRCRHQ